MLSQWEIFLYINVLKESKTPSDNTNYFNFLQEYEKNEPLVGRVRNTKLLTFGTFKYFHIMTPKVELFQAQIYKQT